MKRFKKCVSFGILLAKCVCKRLDVRIYLLFSQGTATFIGCRPRNREVLQRRMYRAEIEEWMKEADLTDKQEHGNGGRRDSEDDHLITSPEQIILRSALTGEGDSYQRAVTIN